MLLTKDVSVRGILGGDPEITVGDHLYAGLLAQLATLSHGRPISW